MSPLGPKVRSPDRFRHADHLATGILLEANLVTYEAQGRQSFYQLDLRGLEILQRYIGSLGLVTKVTR
ncbi:MAG TPA: hypothetical protein VKD23_11385 [Terriglobales bacterium]|nr:hypothetical protein [Terriglobales bacterium]